MAAGNTRSIYIHSNRVSLADIPFMSMKVKAKVQVQVQVQKQRRNSYNQTRENNDYSKLQREKRKVHSKPRKK